jgi:hypothetical protein
MEIRTAVFGGGLTAERSGDGSAAMPRPSEPLHRNVDEETFFVG